MKTTNARAQRRMRVRAPRLSLHYSRIPSMAKASRSSKYVYLFGNKKADGDGSRKALLGGKGANLAEMTRIGLPVPPGFTITTEVCTFFYANRRTYPKELQPQIEAGVTFMEKLLDKKIGDMEKPLL